jgi:uncharacterized protein
MIFLDTNIFLRYFEQNNIIESKKVEELFKRIVSGNLLCFTSTMVISEIIWVLEKYYDWVKPEVCDNIEFILNTPNIKIKERNILRSAISIYREFNIDFIDAYNYAFVRVSNSSAIYSYDLHFDKLAKSFGEIERITP